MKYNGYPKYKTSRVDWLGDVPQHWEVKRLKDLLISSKGSIKTGPFGSQLLTSEMYDNEIKVYNQRNVIDKDFISGDNYISREKFIELKEFQTFPGDFLITTRGTIGKCAILPQDAEVGILHPCLMRLQTNKCKVNDRFLETLIQESGIVLEQLKIKSNGTTIDVIYQDSLKNVIILIPPLAEQEAIAGFLDRETRRIDDLAAKKKRLVELLREKRSALISQTVTKGLDPSASMKPSRVDWLGDVPKHWEVSKINRNATRVQTGNTPPTAEEQYYQDGTIPWYGPSSFNDNIFLSDPVKLINKQAIIDGAARIFSAGTLMIVGIGATIGKVSSINADSSCNQQVTGINFNRTKIDTKFITYQLKQLELTIRAMAPSATLAIFDQNKISNLWIAVPPLSEQEAIAEFLDRETAKIDNLISKVEQAVDKLHEYRTAIISAAVTGKIDVRETR